MRYRLPRLILHMLDSSDVVSVKAPSCLSWRRVVLLAGLLVQLGAIGGMLTLLTCVYEYVHHGVTTAEQAAASPDVLADSPHLFCRRLSWSVAVGLFAFMVVCVCPISFCLNVQLLKRWW
jgi:hypothetical protein